jgi:hypothetical protein
MNDLKTLVDKFRSVKGNVGVSEFIYDNFSQINAEKDEEYPLLFLKYPTISRLDALFNFYNIEFFILSTYFFNSELELRKIEEVQRDLIKIGYDSLGFVTADKIHIVINPDREPTIEFGEFGNDRLIGVNFRLELRQFKSC